MKVHFKRAGIIGVGLIGSSFALALKKYGIVDEVWGYSNSGTSSKKALSLGIIDKVAINLKELTSNCELILVAIPVLAIPDVLFEVSQYVDEKTIVTDGGSTKHFVRDCHKYFKYKNFVGGHPIAGTEKSGPEAGFAELFENSVCIITPIEDTDKDKMEITINLWETIGMKVYSMSPEEHDRIMANISHMPHVIAYSLVDSVKDKYFDGMRITKLAGGGFKDFTRIAKSDDRMWTDIFLANRDFLLSSIDDFQESLNRLKTFIEQKDVVKIKDFLIETKKILLD
ncbi:MAG: prephenate dehydrogenase/arogenate dehydrogenase family protein [Proteobacteria bacterium]|nr:prephenate dehydrogenase/arogenate dehydrogenase family protein [Pseudomonadota bacterium]